jgi:undecaprenyl-diphosphatase
MRAARRGDPAIALRMGVVMGAESALTNGVVKSLFRRIRPDRGDGGEGPLPYGMHRPITSSFPSGHAASAFTAATVLAERNPAAPLYFGLASFVAASRVYVRMHHVSDVLAGAALGLAFGAIARKVLPLRPKR